MTQTTDQDRAEFDNWFRCYQYLPDDADTTQYDEAYLAFKAWKAARRSPVVTVPQGWKLVPIEPTPEMYDRVMREGYYHDEPNVVKAVLRAEYQDMLAAAPQPPESNSAEFDRIKTTPVQMLEPISKMLEDCRSRAIDYATCPSPYNNTRMETAFQYLEHQVRQLLAANGIKTEPQK